MPKGYKTMKITDILDNIDVKSSYIPEYLHRRVILSLCHDSRLASPTCAFFCKLGALTDGHAHAKHAYSNGARIFVAERPLDLPDDAAVIITSGSAEALAKLSVMFYGAPAPKMRIIGITGTKGKTTIALSVYYISLANGMKVGYIGTNGIYYNGKVFETANTTPDVLELQKALREMLDDGVQTVFIEVSSQALWQRRIYGIKFDTCVFTNLYEDHIGGYEHPTFDHYRDCKKLLFSDFCANNIIVNADSPHAEYMLEGVTGKNIFTVSSKGNTDCSLYAKNIMRLKNGIKPGICFECLKGNGNSLDINEKSDVFMAVPGLYSAENGLIIIAICLLLGIKPDTVLDKLSTLCVPGRFETVTLKSRPNSLFVIDYAHNGASLRAVLESLREYEPRRIICLFGSVGGRTFGRRRELGEVAQSLADIIIITSDNPNNEDPQKVINDIRDAMEDTDKPVYMIPDRQKAIEKAVEIAEDGDFILLAGKGHETYQLISGRRVPFSERKILEKADIIFSK